MSRGWPSIWPRGTLANMEGRKNLSGTQAALKGPRLLPCKSIPRFLTYQELAHQAPAENDEKSLSTEINPKDVEVPELPG